MGILLDCEMGIKSNRIINPLSLYLGFARQIVVFGVEGLELDQKFCR